MRFFQTVKVAGLAAILAAAAYGQVTLNPITTPATIGVTVVVQGTGFPAGAIGNNTVSVTITPPPGNGAAVTTQSVGVVAIGAQRLISFTVPPSLVVNAPVVSSVSVAGTTATNNHYTTATPATLTINPPPKISDVSPAAGTVGTASLPVAIAGHYTAFQNTSTITVSGTGVTAVNNGVLNNGASTQLLNATFTIAAGATPGARDVTVKTGTQTVTLPGGFAVSTTPGLSFSSIGPNSGQLGQTLNVTVTGTNTQFVAGTTFVDFGDGITVNLPLQNVTPTSFTANITISPTTYLGWRMVTAVTGGQFAVSGAQGFDVIPGSAALTSVSPNSAAQGTSVTNLVVMGSNTHFLQNASTLSMGAGINVGNIQVDPSGLKLTANIAVGPAAAVGPHDVTVTTGGETETLAGAFNVVPSGGAFLSSVTPASGAQGTSVPILVTGVNTNFLAGTITADLGSNITASVTPNNATSLTINASISPIAITGGRTAILHDNGTDFTFNFTVTASNAQITSVTPNSGPQGGNPSITVTGLNTHWVQGTTTATLGCCTVNRITITPPNSAVLDISIPAVQAVGNYALTMATGGEVVSSGFSVFANTPTLTVSPGSGMIGTTVPINLTGQFTSFNATTTINISGQGVSIIGYNPANNTAASATAKLVIDPAAPLGSRTITVTTGTQVVATTFLVTNSPAVLTSITPNDSPRSNTLSVTITGQNTHFDNTTTAGFGPDVAVNNMAVNQAAQTITANISVDAIAAFGWRTVFVNTGAEQLQIGFRIDSPATPVISGAVNPSSGQQGQTITGVVITGVNTHWDNTTQLFLGAGVTAAITAVTNTQITATISISPTAPIGGNSLVTITGSEVASGAGFTVTRGVAQILSIGPTTLVTQNQTIILTLHGQATHWLQGETTADFGTGVHVDSLTIGPDQLTATAQITVLSTAATGFHSVTLTTDGEIAGINQGIDVEQGTPVLLSSTPNAGLQGQTMNVQILGQMTHWIQGTTTASYSSGIFVNSVSVQDSVTATLSITVDPLAFVDIGGPCRSLTVTTGTEQASLLNQFCVSFGPAQLTGVDPVSSLQGSATTVHVTGLNTHFTAGVTTASFGQGINVSAVHVTGPTTADVDVAISVNADTGLRNVSLQTAGEIASLANAFTVTPGTPTLNGVAPVSGLQGTTFNVHIIGQFTHWVQGSTTATFGQGVTLNSLTIDDNQNADANITIDPLAYTGNRTVTMTTIPEVVSGSFFTVTPGAAIITGIAPSTGNQGQERVFTITGQGTHWAEGITQFSMAGAGLDITVNGFVVNSPTSATADIVIAPNASLYARGIYISTAGEVLSDPGAFVVTGGVPSITFLSPGSGNPGATQLNVNINGVFTNWDATTTVDFGPCVTANGLCISLVNYTVNSNTSITAVINIDPTAPAGFNQVTVRTGNQALTSAFDVVVPTPPTPAISYFAPSVGLPGQTFTTTFNGAFTQWDMTTQVTFGAGIAVNNFQVVTPNSARANITIDPQATAGPRTVTLTTGTDGEIENATFNVVIATPYISIIDPSSALQGETGKDINVIGQYTTWDNTTTFSFGAGVTINTVTVLGPDIARVNVAVDQLATLGARSVTATTGTHIDTGCCFNVSPSLANISSVTPNTALQNAAPTVAVVGQFTHWDPTTTFSFGGSGITVTNQTFGDQTHYSLTLSIAPLATLGTISLTAHTAGETATLSNAFVVQPGTPLILSSAPGAIPQQQTLNLTVLGQDTSWTQAGTSVSFGPNSGIGVLTTSVTADGLGITASINAAATAFTGFRTLYVTTGAQVLTLPNAIFVSGGPAVISQLNPNNGQQNQSNLDVLVTGTNTNFAQGVTTANFGQGITVNSVNVAGPTSATVNVSILPTAATTKNSVSLVTLGEVASAASAFTINPGVPAITFINPSTAKQGDTKDILVTAEFTHFQQGSTAANFGAGVTVNSVTVTDGLHATVNITVPPTTAIGGRDVTLTTSLNGGGQEIVTTPGGFTVQAGPAAITSAVPTTPATVHQGDLADSITITGFATHFVAGTSVVTFCSGVTTTGVLVQSLTSILATVSVSPTAAIGNCGVTVTTEGEVASGSNLFTVLPGVPVISQLSSTSAHQGDTNVNITVTGAFTHFAQGTTTANFGAGVTINSVAIGGATTATVNISVLPSATLGAHDVTMTTGATEVVTLSGGFTILAPVPTMVSGIVTKPGGAAAVGTTVALTPTGGSPLSTVTDGTGSYSFTGVPLGAFTILASDTADNLAASATGSLSAAGQQLTLNIQLAVCSPPPAGLIHWWPGDANANDVVSGANGTLQNGATFGAGEVGQGFSFNNAGYVSVPAVQDMNLTAVTLEGWVMMNSLPPSVLNNAFVVATKGLTAASENYGLYITSNGNVMELMFEYYNAGFQHIFSSGSGLTVGSFHHVGVTADGTSVTFYVDGKQVTQVPQPSPMIPNNSALQIASGQPSFPNSFNGVIDELSLYNRALTPIEIQTIFDAGSNGKCKLCIAPPSNLVSWWTGDSDTSDILGANNSVASNAITFVPGVVGAGFKVGTGGYIDIAASASLANQQFTWSAWARPDGAGPNNDSFGNVIVVQDIDGNHDSVYLDWRATDNHFLFGFGGATDFIVSQHAFPTGQFYHVAGTYDGSTFNLYVNGNLEASLASARTINYSAIDWTIGAASPNIRASNFPRTWNGVIDEVQAFSRALSASEIQGIYAAGAAGECRPAAGSCVVPPSGIAAWWTEDGTLLDATNNNNPAGSNNITFVPGKVGLGAGFSTGSYIDIPEAPDLENQRFTLSAWVRPDGPGPNNDNFGSVVIEQDIDGSNGTAIWWSALSNRFLFGFGNISTEIITSTDTFLPGQFYLVTATYDGAVFSLYVNGKLEGTHAEVKTMAYGSTAWTIGSTNSSFRSGFPRTWNGVIDEVQIYNRALTQAEIQSIFTAGSAGICKPARPALLKPVAYSMQNGQTGAFHYWDDTYNGTGSHTTDLAALSGGVGQLTDGYVAAAPYTVDSGRGQAYEWVGWDTIHPTIVFDFGATLTFHTIGIHSHNQLDVPLWPSVILDFSNDGITFANPVTYTTTAADKANTAARFINIPVAGASGRYVRARFSNATWMFISEVQFQ